jgi:Family of unknown function (DUF6318)
VRLGLTARATAATALTVGLLAMSGCGGSSDDKDPTSAAVQEESPSASPSPTATPPPAPTTARNTSAGRIAFAKYFVKASNYAYATNDATPITSVGSPASSYGCSMCTDLKTYLDGQKAKGLHLEPADLPVKRAFETAHIRDNVWVVDIESSATQRADVDAFGHAVKTYPAKDPYLIEVGVAWENGHYRLTGWKSGENK